jgi:hypothetical protein
MGSLEELLWTATNMLYVERIVGVEFVPFFLKKWIPLFSVCKTEADVS